MRDEYKTPVRFPRDLWASIKQLADEDARSINSEIVWILRNYVEGRKPDAKNIQVPNLSKQDH